MKIVIAGAPGSGKTWLAKKFADELSLYHIEGDDLFWTKGKEALPEIFRLNVREELVRNNWVFEGHLAKVFDILVSHSPVVVVIEENFVRDIFRSMRKDLKGYILGPHRRKHLERMSHHKKNWKQMKKKRTSLIHDYEEKYPKRVLRWNGQSSSLPRLIKSIQSLNH